MLKNRHVTHPTELTLLTLAVVVPSCDLPTIKQTTCCQNVSLDSLSNPCWQPQHIYKCLTVILKTTPGRSLISVIFYFHWDSLPQKCKWHLLLHRSTQWRMLHNKAHMVDHKSPPLKGMYNYLHWFNNRFTWHYNTQFISIYNILLH